MMGIYFYIICAFIIGFRLGILLASSRKEDKGPNIQISADEMRQFKPHDILADAIKKQWYEAALKGRSPSRN